MTQERHQQHNGKPKADQRGHDRHTNGEGQPRQVIAYFPSHLRAQQAAEIVADQTLSTAVEEVPTAQAQQTLSHADTGLSTVEIGVPAWLGLAFGVVVGAVLGWLAYTGPLVIPSIAPALSAGPAAVGFLGAGVLGVLGWLVGALIHLFQTPGPVSPYELRATVTDDALPQVEGTLVDAGALEVLVTGNGAVQPAASGGGSHHH